MKIIRPAIILVSLLPCWVAASQDPATVRELSAYFSERYGPDQNLVSGIRFYNLYSRYKGHRYFGEDRYAEGTLYLDRGIYRDRFLKYDIYGQQVILKVILSDGNFYEMIVTDSRLEGFDLEGRQFRKVYFPSTDTMIAQVIGEDDLYCCFHWSKEVILNRTDLNDPDEFSDMKRKTYLVRDGSIHPYKGARGFSRAFPGHRSEVMSYLRGKKIRIKKSDDGEISMVLSYCREIMNNTAER